MTQKYTSLGLMSGTSGDGVDASLIRSDGINEYQVIKEKYFEYSNEIYQNIHHVREKIYTIKDLEKFEKELNNLEKQITLFHATVVKEMSNDVITDIVGFHGQTIYHNSKDKISKQLGDGKLLSQLTKKNIVYNFRQNDIDNGGEGAPLASIFHQLIVTKKKLDFPTCVLNIGGISNATLVNEPSGSLKFSSKDIGPGNCLIDTWVRKNSKNRFDKNGLLALYGNTNDIVLEQANELFHNSSSKKNLSLDVNDFDVSFARGLSLEDGAATLTDFTAKLIGESLVEFLSKTKTKNIKILICGGGRKNQTLVKLIKQNVPSKLIFETIDDHGINGDFIESQAFAFLAIRTILKMPISFPDTTGCEKPTLGGVIVNFK
tara:strand:- start:3078 stop:4202 length:1125 start_codon:yes stop_codon:yes gene_type:complete